MDTNSSIALLGSTGKAGSAILTALLENGFNVKVLVRDIQRLNHPASARLSISSGDALDPEVLFPVIDGSDAIINATSNTGNREPISSRLSRLIIDRLGADSRQKYFVITGKTVKAKNDRFSIKLAVQRLMLRSMFRDIVNDKQREYEALDKSAIDWTMIRCPLIVEGQDKNYQTSDTRCGGGSITRKGLAQFMLDDLRSRNWRRKALFVYT